MMILLDVVVVAEGVVISVLVLAVNVIVAEKWLQLELGGLAMNFVEIEHAY